MVSSHEDYRARLSIYTETREIIQLCPRLFPGANPVLFHILEGKIQYRIQYVMQHFILYIYILYSIVGFQFDSHVS